MMKKGRRKDIPLQLDSQSGQSPSNEAARRISGWETFFSFSEKRLQRCINECLAD